MSKVAMNKSFFSQIFWSESGDSVYKTILNNSFMNCAHLLLKFWLNHLDAAVKRPQTPVTAMKKKE